MSEGLGQCRVCPASILWATNEFTGRRMPLDPEPTEKGNVLLRHVRLGEPPVAHVTTKSEREELARQHQKRVESGMDDSPFRLFVEHHSACPGRARVDAGELAGQSALF